MIVLIINMIINQFYINKKYLKLTNYVKDNE